jgi:hypothetical protein
MYISKYSKTSHHTPNKAYFNQRKEPLNWEQIHSSAGIRETLILSSNEVTNWSTDIYTENRQQLQSHTTLFSSTIHIKKSKQTNSPFYNRRKETRRGKRTRTKLQRIRQQTTNTEQQEHGKIQQKFPAFISKTQVTYDDDDDDNSSSSNNNNNNTDIRQ